jgi:hypothetical protein
MVGVTFLLTHADCLTIHGLAPNEPESEAVYHGGDAVNA